MGGGPRYADSLLGMNGSPWMVIQWHHGGFWIAFYSFLTVPSILFFFFSWLLVNINFCIFTELLLLQNLYHVLLYIYLHCLLSVTYHQTSWYQVIFLLFTLQYSLQYFQCVTLQTWFGCMLQHKTLQKCLLFFTSSKGRLKMSHTYGALLPDSVWACCRRSMCSQVGCPSFWHCLGGKIQVEMVCICDYIFCSIPGTAFSPGHGKQFVMIWEGICWDLENKLQSE